MSIKIDKNKCVACGKCCKICPGNLIHLDQNRKAFIKYPKDCWGCTACVKECSVGAIQYFLGLDIGGNKGYLYTTYKDDDLSWHIIDQNKEKKTIVIHCNESNKY